RIFPAHLSGFLDEQVPLLGHLFFKGSAPVVVHKVGGEVPYGVVFSLQRLSQLGGRGLGALERYRRGEHRNEGDASEQNSHKSTVARQRSLRRVSRRCHHALTTGPAGRVRIGPPGKTGRQHSVRTAPACTLPSEERHEFRVGTYV